MPKMTGFSQEPDSGECRHSTDGPLRTMPGFEVGRCSVCKNEFAFELNESGERTGQTFKIKLHGAAE
jgi:hypothetical protein